MEESANLSMLHGNCSGPKRFKVVWDDADAGDKAADLWDANIVTEGGAGRVSYSFRPSANLQDCYEMRGTASVSGSFSMFSIRVRGSFGTFWSNWSHPATLFCME